MMASGCSVFSNNDAAQWRQLTVLRVQSRAELSRSVDVSCLSSVGGDSNDLVAVVKYRVNRAPYLQAFKFPAGRTLHESDTVIFHPSQCAIQDESPRP